MWATNETLDDDKARWEGGNEEVRLGLRDPRSRAGGAPHTENRLPWPVSIHKKINNKNSRCVLLASSCSLATLFDLDSKTRIA